MHKRVFSDFYLFNSIKDKKYFSQHPGKSLCKKKKQTNKSTVSLVWIFFLLNLFNWQEVQNKNNTKKRSDELLYQQTYIFHPLCFIMLAFDCYNLFYLLYSTHDLFIHAVCLLSVKNKSKLNVNALI